MNESNVELMFDLESSGDVRILVQLVRQLNEIGVPYWITRTRGNKNLIGLTFLAETDPSVQLRN